MWLRGSRSWRGGRPSALWDRQEEFCLKPYFLWIWGWNPGPCQQWLSHGRLPHPSLCDNYFLIPKGTFSHLVPPVPLERHLRPVLRSLAPLCEHTQVTAGLLGSYPGAGRSYGRRSQPGSLLQAASTYWNWKSMQESHPGDPGSGCI